MYIIEKVELPKKNQVDGSLTNKMIAKDQKELQELMLLSYNKGWANTRITRESTRATLHFTNEELLNFLTN
jgi:hypothetical protein|tara:strand:+ start:119 stop:331 length:213 start_codon:yes stop_codon:yes gene_type:complete